MFDAGDYAAANQQPRGRTAAVHTRAKAAHIGLFDAAAADQQPMKLGFQTVNSRTLAWMTSL